MKLAIAYSTKDQVELTKQTLPAPTDKFDLIWCDGSKTEEGIKFFKQRDNFAMYKHGNLYGGADAAIAWKLSTLLVHDNNYTHIGLMENDVLLDEDWFDPTLELFEKGKQDGLHVGAVSARSYVDRVLIQRDGYAVMHNLGAGMVIFTRQAAEIILRSFRTHWWPANRLLFAQLSGVDLATYAAFRGQEQFVTTDWGWEAQLLCHGLAALALTPSMATMIGQNPPLAEQGLELVALGSPARSMPKEYFDLYNGNLDAIRGGCFKTELPGIIHRDGGGMTFFPHQLGYLAGGPQWSGTLELQWSQGFGPFAYRAGPGGASLSLRISGSCSFLVSGGVTGAKVAITDTRSGFSFAPELPAGMEQFGALNVPGGPVPRTIECKFGEGAVFYGVSTSDPQLLDDTFRFDWSQLPEAK